MKTETPKQPIDISIENKQLFIVDERTINFLKNLYSPLNLQQTKERLRDIIGIADTSEKLINDLDDFIYISKVFNKIKTEKEPDSNLAQAIKERD